MRTGRQRQQIACAWILSELGERCRRDRLSSLTYATGWSEAKRRARRSPRSGRLNLAGGLSPLRLSEIALAWSLRPSARIAIENSAKFLNYFCSDSLAPARECFACGSGRAFLFPSSTHRGYFEHVGPFNLRFCHGVEYRPRTESRFQLHNPISTHSDCGLMAPLCMVLPPVRMRTSPIVERPSDP